MHLRPLKLPRSASAAGKASWDCKRVISYGVLQPCQPVTGELAVLLSQEMETRKQKVQGRMKCFSISAGKQNVKRDL